MANLKTKISITSYKRVLLWMQLYEPLFRGYPMKFYTPFE